MKTKKIVISILTLIVMVFAFAACEKPIKATKVNVNKTGISLVVGATEKLTYSVEPKGANIKSAKWACADDKIATVKADGTVTAVAVGKVDVTITVDELSAKCVVTVVAAITQAEKDAAAFRTAHASILTKKLADVVVADKAAVTAAKTALDALSAEAKLIVKTDGENLAAFAAKIANIEAGNTLATAKAAAKTALDAYDNTIVYADGGVARIAAIAVGKSAIDAATTVKGVEDAQSAAQTAIDALTSKLEDDTAAANKVTATIAALPDAAVITLTDKGAVIAARAAYGALNAEAKLIVTPVAMDKLVTCEAKIAKLEADTAAAKAVDDAINALPAVDAIALTDKAAVKAARDAYAVLNADAAALVTPTNVTKLEACEAQLVVLDAAAATPVIKAIQALPTVNASSAVKGILLCDKPTVDAALLAYNALSIEGKALVTNYDVLTAANAKIVAFTAAAPVDTEIGAIADGATITSLTGIGMAEAIANVETANTNYGLLAPQAKALVQANNVEKLTLSVKKIADLRVADVIDKEIASIRLAVDIADLTQVTDINAVEAAKANYDAMTNKDAKALVKTELVAKLDASVAKILQLNTAAAGEVETKISAIGTLTIVNMVAENDNITAARTAYNALRPAAKLLVDHAVTNNTAKLAAAETAYADCVAAKVVQTAINEISVITELDNLTQDSTLVDKIAAVEVQYLALTTARKALLTADDMVKYDAATGKVVALKIAAIPANTDQTHATKVAEVRVAYDKLTSNGKTTAGAIATLNAKEVALLVIEIDAIVASKVAGAYTIAAHAARIGAAQAMYDKIEAADKATDVTNKAALDTAITDIKDLYIAQLAVELAKYPLASYEDADHAIITTANSTATTNLSTVKVLAMQAEIDKFVAAADKVVTKATTKAALAAAKLTEIAKLNAALAVYVEESYSTNNYAVIITAYNTGKTAINSCADLAAITTANAVTAFDNAAKAVKTEATLKAEAELDKIAKEAAATIGLVEALKADVNTITVADDDAKIKAARVSYDALSAGAKALVLNRERVFLGEKKIAALNVFEAAAVNHDIVALVEAATWDATNVTTVAAAYNALTLEGQALVLPANLAKLAGFEAKQFTLIVTNKIDTTTPTQQGVDDVKNAKALMTKAGQAAIVASDIAKIDAAEVKLFKAAVAAITDNETIPINVPAAEAAFKALSATATPDAADILTLNAAQAKLTVNLIAALPAASNIVVGSNGDIKAARASYEALRPEAKAKVANIATLDTAEVKLVAVLIANATTKENCNLARAAYTALTDAQKTALESENNKLVTLETAEAGIVIALITSLPVKIDVAYANKADIVVARAEFDLLTAGAQAKVTDNATHNTAKLTDAEGVIARLEKAAAAVDALILALPKYSALTAANETAVATANNALNAITDIGAKALVLNQKALEVAVLRIAELTTV